MYRKRILLFENNLMNRRLYCEILKRLDVEIDIESDGENITDNILIHPPNLIAIGIEFPLRKSQLLIHAIREITANSDVQIVALSACNMKGDREALLSSGCDYFIPIPIEIHSFYNTFQNCLLDQPAENLITS
jgi:two-component system cell cycle response regulator DivK